MKLTFVIPAYNERDTVGTLTEGILEHARPHEVRLLFVDDGSTDGTAEALRGLRERFANVEVLRFRRNFGKSAALSAGFERADGDVVFTMDADLQDDPAEIPRFVEKIGEGYDVVVGWKQKRHDPWHKTFPSHVYNTLVDRVFRLPIHDINCGFKAYRIEVVKRVPVYGEMHRLLPAPAAALGYRVTEIPVTHHARRYGVSKYGFERFARGAVDALTTWFLLRHAYTPGHFFGKVGLACLGKGVVAWMLSALIWGIGSPAPWLLLVMFALSAALLVSLGLTAELVLRREMRPGLSQYLVVDGAPPSDPDA